MAIPDWNLGAFSNDYLWMVRCRMDIHGATEACVRFATLGDRHRPNYQIETPSEQRFAYRGISHTLDPAVRQYAAAHLTCAFSYDEITTLFDVSPKSKNAAIDYRWEFWIENKLHYPEPDPKQQDQILLAMMRGEPIQTIFDALFPTTAKR